VIARKARFYVNRLDIILADFEYDMLHGDLRAVMELGIMLSLAARKLPAPSTASAKPLTRQALYEAISGAMETDDQVKHSLAAMVENLVKLPNSEIAFLRQGLVESKERFNEAMRFTEDEAFMAAPFHLVFQTERFKSAFGSVVSSLDKLYRYVEQARPVAIEKESLVKNLMMRLVELTESETPLSSNVKSYRKKGIFWLTIRFMFRGRM
jgi:hypothetical protein